MTLAREQAVQAIEKIELYGIDSKLTDMDVVDAVAAVRQLEPKQRQLVLTELATRVWLRPCQLGIPLYPQFEGVLRAHFFGQDDLEQAIFDCLGTCQASMSVRALYTKFLQGMFAASGKTRLSFYKDILTEAGVEMELEDAAFGDKALSFLKSVLDSVHKEHLLVFYYAGLALKVSMARDPSAGSFQSEESLDAICRYFEEGIPLEGRFLQYTRNSAFLKHSLEEGRLSKIR